MNIKIKKKCLENKTTAKRIRNVTGMLSEQRKCKSCEFLLRFPITYFYIFFNVGFLIVILGIGSFVSPSFVLAFYPTGIIFVLMTILFSLTINSLLINFIQEAQLSYADITASFIDVSPKILKGVYEEFDKTLKSLK